MHFNKDQILIERAAANIRLLILDVDGVLTDGRLYFSNAGEELKAFHTLLYLLLNTLLLSQEIDNS